MFAAATAWLPTVLHPGAPAAEPDLLLAAVVGLAALGAAVLLGLGLAVLVRRRSQPYVLIVAALAALLARSVVAGLDAVAMLPTGNHHLLEHALDVAMAGLVIAAVYHARSVEDRARRRLGRTDGGRPGEEQMDGDRPTGQRPGEERTDGGRTPPGGTGPEAGDADDRSDDGGRR